MCRVPHANLHRSPSANLHGIEKSRLTRTCRDAESGNLKSVYLPGHTPPARCGKLGLRIRASLQRCRSARTYQLPFRGCQCNTRICFERFGNFRVLRRPAPAVWGNGSVGFCGLEPGDLQLVRTSSMARFSHHEQSISVTAVTVLRDLPHHSPPCSRPHPHHA